MPATAIIPAYRAAATIADTVRAARAIPGVAQVVVVDDGSPDETADAARAAGADAVISLPSNRGKGAALQAGLDAAHHEAILFLDADLGSSAAAAAPLLDALSTGADMSIAVLPSRPRSGGLGLALRLARAAIRLLSGLDMAAPMSGQRALTKKLARHVGIAPRFGVEVALTAEAAHAGASIREVPLPLDHSHTGRTLSGFRHRGRQFADILRYLLPTAHGLAWPALPPAAACARLIIFILALVGVLVVAAIPPNPALSSTFLAIPLALILWLPLLWLTTIALHIRKPNYLGRTIPGVSGLIFPVVGLLALKLIPLQPPLGRAAFLTLAAFGALGLLDDLFGARSQARGLRGHLLALLRGRLTTGMLKAIGGLAAAFAAGGILHPGRPDAILADTLLIALSANLLNLLDLRPGRALKAFALIAAPALALSPTPLAFLCPLLAAGAVSAPSDLAGRTMMGDVGANTLGAALGLALAVWLGPIPRLVAIIILIALHLLCERLSLTALIARSRPLVFLDRLGAAHLPPFTPHQEAPIP